MTRRNIIIASFISVFLFMFISFLIYVVYCFSFYDKNQIDKYINNFNNGSYDFVYNNMVNKEKINKEDFNYSINLMFNNEELESIYNDYFTSINKEIFIDKYSFSNKVDNDYFSFKETGKTTFFERKKIEYDKVIVKSKDGKSTFGVLNNITLNVENNSKLIIDNKECKITDNKCVFEYLLSGLHTIKYESGSNTYFGIVNIVLDNSSIDITTIDDLVKIDDVKGVSIDNKKINIGLYKDVNCLEKDECFFKNRYIELKEDNSFYMYLADGILGFNETYKGTYDIQYNKLYLHVNEYIYNNVILNTQNVEKGNDIILFEFTINGDNSFSNETYNFRENE